MLIYLYIRFLILMKNKISIKYSTSNQDLKKTHFTQLHIKPQRNVRKNIC